MLRNGRTAWRGAVADTSIDRLVQLMGGDANPVHQHGAAAVGLLDQHSVTGPT
ncbi:hypothetical protein [Mesorhizobium sp.]|uniref:hypothetical protein n=1 Tax=Mesorhizobium sp. TaxID=1871066 RepID=UPI0025FC8898|nr:hypothetical protein [Mesorhizobium sp.]